LVPVWIVSQLTPDERLLTEMSRRVSVEDEAESAVAATHLTLF
jgi:hypothetical protein